MIKRTSVTACSFCTATPSSFKDRSMYCATCNMWFLSEKRFQNHLTPKVKGKLVSVDTSMPKLWFYSNRWSKHECFKRFCNYCNK